MFSLRELFEEFLIAYRFYLFAIAADFFEEAMIVVVEPVVGVVEETAEVVLINLVDVYVEFQVGQTKKNLPILFNGPGMNMEVVGNVGVAH